ncbi:MAG: hypothetical protein ACK4YP_22245, partial [Myxococcota bacterium]
MLLLLAGALAAPVDLDPVDARLSGTLRDAVRAYGQGRIDAWRDARVEPPPEDGLSVTVAADDVALAWDALDGGGFVVEAVAGDLV